MITKQQLINSVATKIAKRVKAEISHTLMQAVKPTPWLLFSGNRVRLLGPAGQGKGPKRKREEKGSKKKKRDGKSPKKQKKGKSPKKQEA